MTVRALGVQDVPWMVQALHERRGRLVPFAPVFWRPAADATRTHTIYLTDLLASSGAKAYGLDSSVLIAVPGGDGWIVDDFHVANKDWTHDCESLWAAFAADCSGSPVRLVSPVYEPRKATFSHSHSLTLAESWWLRELDTAGGGQGNRRVALPGATAVTVDAPPVYAPGGPVLYLPRVQDAEAALKVAGDQAAHSGCVAVVVNQAADDTDLAATLTAYGYRRHCDYFTGII